MESKFRQLLGQALSLHQSGQIDNALEIYRQALALAPENPDALLFTAVACCQKGNYPAAAELFAKIPAKLMSDNPNYFINYGLTLSETGELDKAVEFLQKGTVLDPDAFEARFNLGRCYFRLKNFPEAETAFSAALELSPEDVEALAYLGAALIEQNKLAAGLQQLEQAFGKGNETSFLRYYAAIAFEREGQHLEAEKQYARSLTLDTRNTGAHLGLSRIYALQGKFEAAINEIEQTRDSTNKNLEVVLECSLSTIAHLQADNTQAEIHARKALALAPESTEACGLLGLALSNTRRQIAALDLFKRATEIPNPNPMHLINKSKNLTAIGLTQEAIATAEQAFAVNSTSADAFSSLLLYLHYPSGISSEDISSLHQQYGKVFGGNSQQTATLEISATSPRIGFISGDFCVHSIQFFFEPLLREISQNNELEVILYSNTPLKDQQTKRYIEYADRFSDIRHLDNTAAYKLIKHDNLNALIDLSGHTNNNRLPLLALKPAKTQLTYMGYPDTTGLQQIDFRLSDNYADPTGSEKFYTENLYRLPGCFLTYQPPEYPEIQESTREGVIFGSFNNIAKISEETLIMWSEILKKLPSSSLMLKCHGLNKDDLKLLLAPKFQKHGIESERLIFCDLQPDFQQHLKLYNRIDIALDTFPYNGTTTTFEALLMGRPVITRFSDTHVTAVGKSILTNISAAELITASREEYISKAISLGSDKPEILRYQQKLRQMLTESGVCDSKLFYKNFIEALKKMQIIR